MTTEDRRPGHNPEVITEEYSFDELAKGLASGALTRSRALESVRAAILGGALAIFGLADPAKARNRRPLPTTFAFVHTSADANLLGNCTAIDNPLTNANTNAVLVVTHRAEKFDVLDSPLAAYYGPEVEKWIICREDGSAMPPGESFNVVAGLGSGSTQRQHRAGK